MLHRAICVAALNSKGDEDLTDKMSMKDYAWSFRHTIGQAPYGNPEQSERMRCS